MKTPDNSIDFKPVSVEEAGRAKSPAEHAAHMKSLENKFNVPEKHIADKPEDSAKVEALVQSLEVKPVVPEENMENSNQIVDSNESKGEVVPTKNKESLLKSFLGEELTGTTRFKEASIDDKQSANAKSINKTFFKTGLVPLAAGALTGLGAWIAAGSGVGLATSVAGVPLMTAVALGAAPVGIGIAAIAGTVWAGRRLLNRFKANKARESLY